MLKLAQTNQQTNQKTNQQGKNNMSPTTICLQTKCGWTDGWRTKTNPKTSPEQSAIFQFIRDINKTNVLTKFHDDLAKKITSRVLKRKTAHTPWRPCFLTDRDHFQTHLRYKGLAAIVHVFQRTRTILERNSLHEIWAKNVTSRVFTCFHYIHIDKTAPPTGGHVFSPIWTIFELVGDINKRAIMALYRSTVFMRKNRAMRMGLNVLKHLEGWPKPTNQPTDQQTGQKQYVPHHYRNLPHPPGSHVFKQTRTIFELTSRIKETNVLTKFHEDWTKNVTSRVLTSKTAPPLDINKTNVLTKFHDEWGKSLTSRVFTRKIDPPTGCLGFQRTGTTF
ncbi:hypothetical protein DPMN_053960 [Dreissena polymorpha]|uniref:Uncharacterized protein n=1 Tax=Dreissena polymorpha TaxID=45954 RepID=A0A9D4CPP0_DREPO|nr:hypothetical protein DPMN_053960 [Dreissena polymorpha]